MKRLFTWIKAWYNDWFYPCPRCGMRLHDPELGCPAYWKKPKKQYFP